MGDQGWTEVKGRTRTSVFHRLGNIKLKASKFDQLEKVSVNIYIANFPSHLYPRELRVICGKVGTVIDVYIAKKINAQGQSYGFVRFIRVEYVDALVKSLCNTRIGQLWLYANVSRRPRNAPSVPTKRPTTVKAELKVNSHARRSGVSYATMVSGKVKEGDEATQDSHSTSVSIDYEVMNKSAYPFALVACFKDYRAIMNLRSMCQGEGFMDVEPKYLGGLWVLLDFQSLSGRDAFLKHNAFMSWFSDIKPWHNGFVVKERLLWVEVEGLPLLAWCNEMFKRVAAKWEELVFVDNSDNTNRFSIRLGIKIVHAPLVFESVLVNVLGVEYFIQIRELSSWTPTFIDGFKTDEGEAELDHDGEDSESNDSVHSKDAFFYASSPIHQEEMVDPQPVEEKVGNCSEPKATYQENNAGVDIVDSDPFEIAELIDKELQKPKTTSAMSEEQEVNNVGFPPGFDPMVSAEGAMRMGDVSTEDVGDVLPENYVDDLPRTPVLPDVTVAQDGFSEPRMGVDGGDDGGKRVAHENPFLKHTVSVLEKLDSAIGVGNVRIETHTRH
ncbi:hypothetical protein LXL04_034366 [Taraxacum kok-saghyz]